MSAIDYAWDILKMGVALPEDAKGPFDHPDDPDLHVYESPSRTFTIPKKTGRYPDNPGDPHHGHGVEPWWSEGGKRGYHPEAEESPPKMVAPGVEAEDWQDHLDTEGDDQTTHQQAMMEALGLGEDEPKSQMHQQLEAPAAIDENVRVGPEGMNARDMMKLTRPQMEEIIQLANAEMERRTAKKN